MKILLLILYIVLLHNCTLNKVTYHHGIHNLEKKQEKLKINQTNKNDILSIIGPPSTKSVFENDVFIYIEKKSGRANLSKLGARKLITNNVLVLEINNKGILVSKKLYNMNNMNNIEFDRNETPKDYSKESFINRVLFSVRQKIDDPLGKKRTKD